jgi:hypothetical protein
MIADLDETLRKLMIDEFPIKNGEIEISFDQPKREWSSRISRPTINFFLYDVRENNILRQHQWERMISGGNGGQNAGIPERMAHLKRTPFRVDCYYMLTTWATVPEDEHRLLSRSLMVLFKHPVLPAKRLEKSLVHQPFEIQTRLASHDKLTNPAEVWSSLDNEMRPSVSYIITLALDPWEEMDESIVTTFTMRSGQSTKLPLIQELSDKKPREVSDIGGIVRDSKQKGQPKPGVTVTVDGHGWSAISNKDGKFVLASLPPGDYTLIFTPPEGKPAIKNITIPSADGIYEVEL